MNINLEEITKTGSLLLEKTKKIERRIEEFQKTLNGFPVPNSWFEIEKIKIRWSSKNHKIMIQFEPLTPLQIFEELYFEEKIIYFSYVEKYIVWVIGEMKALLEK